MVAIISKLEFNCPVAKKYSPSHSRTYGPKLTVNMDDNRLCHKNETDRCLMCTVAN